jgi:hypothetical protein
MAATLPVISPGAPNLATHLLAMLGLVSDRIAAGSVVPTEAELDTMAAAMDALDALPKVEPAVIEIAGRAMVANERGGYDPVGIVPVTAQLEDQLVRTIVAGALAVSASIGRFKGLSFFEAEQFLELLAAEHGVSRAGSAGNVSLFSYDRRYRVQFTVQERIAFTAEVKLAQEVFAQWVEQSGASPEVQAVISDAFRLDDQGQLRAWEVLRLKRRRITDPLWIRAMGILDAAMISAGSTRYMRVYQRGADGRYVQISLDLASAKTP